MPYGNEAFYIFQSKFCIFPVKMLHCVQWIANKFLILICTLLPRMSLVACNFPGGLGNCSGQISAAHMDHLFSHYFPENRSTVGLSCLFERYLLEQFCFFLLSFWSDDFSFSWFCFCRSKECY